MAEIIPFNGVLYNPEKVDGSDVTAPPYDIVTPEFKDTLYSRSPYNIIRIDFGKDNEGDNEEGNRYTRAAGDLNSWLEQGVLTQDEKPAFYCYEAAYETGGVRKTVRGFLGAVKIEELGSGHVHPHEMTYSKPKADRLNILRFCMANISPIFSLYSSQEKIASSILERTVKEKAFIEAKDENGSIHRLWQINDEASIEAIKKEMSDKEVFIADGHHRYETALGFRDEMDKVRGQGSGVRGQDSEVKPWDYVMMLLVNMEDEGLSILPTHRLAETGKERDLIKVLEPHFDIKAVKFKDGGEKQARQEMFSAMQKGRHTLGMFIKGEKAYYILNFKAAKLTSEVEAHESLKRLDVTILHKLVFEKLFKIENYEYEMDPDVAIEKLKNSHLQTIFFLNPTKVHDVKEVALAGERMPPKSTYFYPKLLTGMVIYKF